MEIEAMEMLEKDLRGIKSIIKRMEAVEKEKEKEAEKIGAIIKEAIIKLLQLQLEDPQHSHPQADGILVEILNTIAENFNIPMLKELTSCYDLLEKYYNYNNCSMTDSNNV